jgi:hypothetical protein
MLEEVSFIDKQQIHLYLCNKTKVYQNGYYWEVTGMGTEKKDALTHETLELKRIDHVVDEIWESTEPCKVDLE